MNVRRILTWIELPLGILMLSRVLAKNKMDAYMTNVECLNYVPEILKNVSCHLNQTTKSTSSLYIEFALAQDVKDVEGIYILTMKRGSIMTNLTTMKLDFCQLLASAESQFILKMVTTQIRRIGNLPLECPFKMNKRYYVKGFTINSKLIPRYLPEMNFISDAHINLKDRRACRLIIQGSLRP